MKRSIYLLYTAALLLTLAQACKQTEIAPVLNDGVAPGPVSNASVVNLSGAAEIFYELPADKDVLYVKALYTSRQGEVRETKVSYYNNSITVVGFGDTSAHEVTLYAVDKGGNVSPPLAVTVYPEKAPFMLVRDSLRTAPDFGGINVTYKNMEEDNVAIVVITDDSLGNRVPVNTHYTNLRQGNFSIRDRPPVPTEFGVYVRDRWGNVSDTLTVTLTPLFELRLDRTKMRGVTLPTDAPLGYGGSVFGLFDGSLDGGAYHSSDDARMPQWFTYDMGVTAKLSRLAWFMRPGFYYNLHNPRVVEIWGSNDPAPDGSFDNWILLT
ncbi:MAG TPA: DUF4959 domain-containing protein, partial [Anseongella sp.]|nr:DUF4959 domain-containing protein [Anseongella sp.]